MFTVLYGKKSISLLVKGQVEWCGPEPWCAAMLKIKLRHTCHARDHFTFFPIIYMFKYFLLFDLFFPLTLL